MPPYNRTHTDRSYPQNHLKFKVKDEDEEVV